MSLLGGGFEMDPEALTAMGASSIHDVAMGAGARTVFQQPQFAHDNDLRNALRHDEGAEPSLVSTKSGLNVHELRKLNREGSLPRINAGINGGFPRDSSSRSRNHLVDTQGAATAQGRSATHESTHCCAATGRGASCLVRS